MRVSSYSADTSVVMALARNGPIGQYILAQYPEVALAAPVISYVTIAELLSIAARNKWGRQRIEELEYWLNKCRVIPIDTKGILDAYVQIDVYSLEIGRSMGKNDLWIAATTSVMGATLLTTDKDFDHLDPTFLTCLWIDPTSRI